MAAQERGFERRYFLSNFSIVICMRSSFDPDASAPPVIISSSWAGRQSGAISLNQKCVSQFFEFYGPISYRVAVEENFYD
jgi:hypothetical protein